MTSVCMQTHASAVNWQDTDVKQENKSEAMSSPVFCEPHQFFLIFLCILIATKPKTDGNKEKLTNQKDKTYAKELSTILKKIIRIWGQMLLI